MNKEMMLAENSNLLEIKGVRCYEKNGIAYLNLEDVARGLGFTRIAKSGNEVVRWERVLGYLKDFNYSVPTSGHDSESNGRPSYIPENIFYRLAMKANNETAEKFQAVIADEVIPAIRKHGGYLTPKTINDLLTDPDTIIKLATILKEEQEKNKQLQAKNEYLESEVAYKEDVIVGLVEDIDLATKRQRINQIVRHGVSDCKAISSRWNLLYGEFEKKYHLNLSVRLERNKNDFKPKLKNNLDLIDRQMHMIPQLYEICCKLFENDVAALMTEWEYTVA